MKCVLHRLLFGSLCCLFCFAPSSQAQTSAASGPKSASPDAVLVNGVPRKQDRSALGQSVGVGPSSSADGQSPIVYSYSNGATFINPKPRQIFHPGETIHIDLDVDPSIKPVAGIGIISPIAYSNETRSGPPYAFTLTLPDKDIWGKRLIGLQGLTLFGTVVGRNDYDFAGVTVDVEEADLPLSLTVAGNFISQVDPTHRHMDFVDVGEDDEIAVYAQFQNQREVDVTTSTYLSLVSENPAVVIISDEATITSTGPGVTRIIATYSLGAQRKVLTMPATVKVDSKGLNADPAFFNFGDVRTGATSRPLRVKLTNHTVGDIRIGKLESRWSGSADLESCSHATLPAGGSCTMSVTFTPIQQGPVSGRIYIGNDFNPLSIAFVGKGI